MTEAEAKEKWCPIAPHTVRPDGAVYLSPKCVGSACMMWRVKTYWTGEEWTTFVHCGLAGKP